MQWYRETVWIDTPSGRATEQALVEGRIAPPAFQPAVEEVLMADARAVCLSVEPMSGRVMLEGRVFFNVIYAAEGSVWAFESSATFKHGMDMAGVDAGARCRADVSLAGLEHTMEAGVLNVRAAVNIDCTAAVQKELQIYTNAQDTEDIQMLTDTAEFTSRADAVHSSMLLRDEVMIAQGLPACERILHTSAWPAVRSVTCEDGKLVVDGEVNVNTTYLCGDPAAPLQQRSYALPFAHMIMMRDVKEGMEGAAWANVAEIYAQTAGGAEGEAARAFSYEIVLNFEAEATRKRRLGMVCDVYSPTRVLAVEREDVEMEAKERPNSGQTLYQGTAEYEGYDRGLKVLSAHAYPLVASATCGEDGVRIEGVAFVRAVCIDREGQLVPQDVRLPFSLDIGIPCGENMSLQCALGIADAQAQCKGSDMEVKLTFSYMLGVASVQRLSLLTKVTPTEEAVEPMSGITVYFAQPGEKLWNIAKRYATTVDAIRQANPDVGDDVSAAGKKLILYRPGA